MEQMGNVNCNSCWRSFISIAHQCEKAGFRVSRSVWLEKA